jgi:hypothetical protein
MPQGGGNFFLMSKCLPSPSAGAGRVRGNIPNFSHLTHGRGGERVFFLTFYGFIQSEENRVKSKEQSLNDGPPWIRISSP